jgi:protein-S-isoprenylcysteine O-methyltransferase Ste14
MHAAAVIELVLSWLAWTTPFVIAARKRRSHAVAARDPRARQGILLQFVACGLAWMHPPRAPAAPLPLLATAMVLAPVSAICAWAALRHLAEHWRFEAALSEDHRLVRSGPYRFVRHPIYASMFGMVLATGVIVGYWPFLLAAIVLFVAGTEIRIRAEEALLAGRFGAEFEAYKQRVAAYVPYLR